MKPNSQTLAINTGLISSLPGSIRHHHFPINIAVQRCAALLGFVSLSPTYQATRTGRLSDV